MAGRKRTYRVVNRSETIVVQEQVLSGSMTNPPKGMESMWVDVASGSGVVEILIELLIVAECHLW